MSKFINSLGKKGETAVSKNLQKQGFSLLEENYRVPGGEIDLIMEKKGRIVFIEVKTRRNEAFGTPLESITPQKKQRLIYTATRYLQAQKLCDADISFWAAAVYADSENQIKNIEIFEDIFI